jgi:hypothetical protein
MATKCCWAARNVVPSRSAIGAQRLAVDPGAVGTGEESDGGSDVRRLAQALKWR